LTLQINRIYSNHRKTGDDKMIIQANVTNHTYKIMTDEVKAGNGSNSCAFGKRWVETKQAWSKERWFHFSDYKIEEE
jgi:hypothetical protein